MERDWAARLLCVGERWTEVPALRDPSLAGQIEVRPQSNGRLPRRRLLRQRPDLVHFHSAASALKGIRLQRLLGYRVVISFRDSGLELKRPGLDLLWEKADLFLFADAALLEDAVARGCPTRRAAVHRPPLPSPRAATNGREGGSRPLRIVSAGRLSWENGFEHSVHAVRLLLDAGIECEYRILGEGEHVVAVGFARHELGLASQVKLVWPDGGDRLVAELSNADVFLDPAVTDGVSPLPLATAQALGIPFVASRRGGLSEDAGIAVPRRDPAAIAEAIAGLARDPGLRRRLGQAGLGRNNGYPSPDEDARRLAGLYRRALG